MKKTIILAERPDLVIKLEKYNLIPEGRKGGVYEGIAKKWAEEKTAPYDKPEYQAMAERLPTGWEELTKEEMKALLEKLGAAIASKKKEKLDIPNKGSEKMLKSLTQIVLLGIAAAATLLVENGLGALPDADEGEKKRAKEFSFELVLHLINGTDFLTILFRNIAATANTGKKNQELIAEVLKLAAIFLAILAASNDNEDRLKTLLLSFKTTIQKGIEQAENFVSGKLAEEAVKGEAAERCSLYLQQAGIALEKEDFTGFNEAFSGLLEAIEIKQEDFNKDIKKIRLFAKNLESSIQATIDDSTSQFSAMSQAM